FELRDTTPGVYLHHRSGLGEFQLSSDAVIATFIRYPATAPIIGQVPQADSDEFDRIGYTMGGMMVFPGNRVDGKPTINQARGLKSQDLRPDGPAFGVHPPLLPARGQPSRPDPGPVRRLLCPVRGFPGLR